MKTLYDYCFYRIAKFYKIFDDEDYHSMSNGLLFFTLGCLFLAFISFTLQIFGYKLTETIIKIGVLPVVILDAYFTICRDKKTREKYAILEKKYRNEKHKTLKGWLIVLYIIATVFIYGLSI